MKKVYLVVTMPDYDGSMSVLAAHETKEEADAFVARYQDMGGPETVDVQEQVVGETCDDLYVRAVQFRALRYKLEKETVWHHKVEIESKVQMVSRDNLKPLDGLTNSSCESMYGYVPAEDSSGREFSKVELLGAATQKWQEHLAKYGMTDADRYPKGWWPCIKCGRDTEIIHGKGRKHQGERRCKGTCRYLIARKEFPADSPAREKDYQKQQERQYDVSESECICPPLPW